MITNEAMAQDLERVARLELFVNHQSGESLKRAARRLRKDAETIAALREELAYLRGERYGIEHEEDLGEAAAPGEAAEDFWGDDWPDAE